MSGEILLFYSVCPAKAESEMRWISIKNHPELPDGELLSLCLRMTIWNF